MPVAQPAPSAATAQLQNRLGARLTALSRLQGQPHDWVDWLINAVRALDSEDELVQRDFFALPDSDAIAFLNRLIAEAASASAVEFGSAPSYASAVAPVSTSDPARRMAEPQSDLVQPLPKAVRVASSHSPAANSANSAAPQLRQRFRS